VEANRLPTPGKPLVLARAELRLKSLGKTRRARWRPAPRNTRSISLDYELAIIGCQGEHCGRGVLAFMIDSAEHAAEVLVGHVADFVEDRLTTGDLPLVSSPSRTWPVLRRRRPILADVEQPSPRKSSIVSSTVLNSAMLPDFGEGAGGNSPGSKSSTATANEPCGSFSRSTVRS